MASSFPTSLDDLYGNQPYVDGTTVIQAAELNNIQDAVDELQEKVGVDASAVATSIDFFMRRNYVKVSDVKAAGADGGTFTAGDWRTRTLNTKDNDAGSLCSLSSNQITLSAGTYRCKISALAFGVNNHQARLYNVTGSALVVLGTVEFSSSNAYAATRSIIVGQFTIAAGQALEVQHYAESTRSNTGFSSGIDWGNNVYTVAEFWKLY